MENKQTLGLIGGILLCIGAFLPFLGNNFAQATYIQVTEWEGYVIVGIGAIVIIISAAKQNRFLGIPIILTLLTLGYTFMNYYLTQESSTPLMRELRALQFGAAILIVGALLTIVAGVSLKKEKTKEEKK